MQTPLRVGFLGCLILLGVAWMPAISAGQIFPTTEGVEIAMSPESPQPNKETTATVTGFGVNTQTASITWTIDGTIVAQGVGRNSYSFTSSSLGDVQRLEVAVTTPQGKTFFASRVVRPIAVTLLWEGETYTPPFYNGRALYTSGSNVRLEARAIVKSVTGNRVDPQTLLYTWKRNGSTLTTLSGVGRTGVVVEGPAFLGSDIFEVVVTSLDDVYSGSSAVRISTTDPIIQLYESDPLVGVRYYASVDTHTSAPASEQFQIQAIPYYMDAYSVNDSSLDYTWRTNGVKVFGSPETPSTLSIQFSSTETIETTIDLVVSHTQHLLQSGKRIFTLSFEGSARNSFFGF